MCHSPGTLVTQRTCELHTKKLSRMFPGWLASMTIALVVDLVLVQIHTREDNSSCCRCSFCCSWEQWRPPVVKLLHSWGVSGLLWNFTKSRNVAVPWVPGLVSPGCSEILLSSSGSLLQTRRCRRRWLLQWSLRPWFSLQRGSRQQHTTAGKGWKKNICKSRKTKCQ